jgi:hypothetical protein
MTMMIERIVSGGQTGADRAALDWAIVHQVSHGGWCPEGRLSEDGAIPERYLVEELPGAGYRQRTKANVRDSDATLIISISSILSGGSLETAKFAGSLRKPWLHLHQAMDWKVVLDEWVCLRQISILNVAGPRSSKEPAVGTFTFVVLDELKRILNQRGKASP